MASLHDYFKNARRHEPLMNEDQLNVLLDRYESESPTGPRTDDRSSVLHKTGMTMKIISIALMAAVAGLAPFIAREPGDGGSPPGGGVAVVQDNRTVAVIPEREENISGSNPVETKRRSTAAGIGAADRSAATVGHPVPHTPIVMSALHADTPAVAPRKPDTLAVRMKVRTKQDNAGIRVDMSPVSPNIPGIGMIELEELDLARLGIRVTPRGIYSTWWKPGEDLFSWTIAQVGLQIHVPPQVMEGVEPPDVSPLAITDDLGGYRAIIYNESEEEKKLMKDLREGEDRAEGESRIQEEMLNLRNREIEHAVQIGRLVPVLVRTGITHMPDDSLARRHRPDCIFWYEPTPKFLERLPAGLRLRVEREMSFAEKLHEMESANGVGSGEIRTAIASDIKATVGAHPYLDVLRGSAGVLMETSLDPNPAREQATLTYRLSNPRAVSLALHDISGRRLRELVPSEPKEAGGWSVPLDLHDLPQGMYLVVISTDRKEQAVQRLIVQQ